MSKKEYNASYDAQHTIQIKIKLNIKTDADILAKLNVVPNKQGYIKSLIRENLKEETKC